MLASFIDASYYKTQASVALDGSEELVEHFLRIGWRVGLNPSPSFQVMRYLDATSGVREAGKNPFIHYLFEVVGEDDLAQAFGDLSAVAIGTLRAHFDASWYLYSYPEVEASGADAFIDYMTAGWRAHRDPSPAFSTSAYLLRYPDIAQSGMNPFVHWVLFGRAEGRSGRGAVPPLGSWEGLSDGQRSILAQMFSLDYYRAHAAGADPGPEGTALDAARFVSSGGTVAGYATPSFHASRYAAAHPELAGAEQVPLLHFLFAGVGEGALRDLFADLPLADVEALCRDFDASWYLYSYPEVEASGADAFIDYMTAGWRAHRDPSPAFSTSAYLLRYPDIAQSGMNPFVHWVLFGRAEGRSGRGAVPPLGSWEGLSDGQRSILAQMFSLDYYRAHAAGADPGPEGTALDAARFVSSGGTVAGYATPSFHASRYAAAHPELAGAEQVPLLHFLFAGVGEGALRDLFADLPLADVEALCRDFDASWYLYSYPEVEASGADAFIDYMTAGWRAHRDPSPAFSTSAYLLRYPDIAQSGMNPFVHWVLFGRAEGRSGASSGSTFRTRPYAPSVTAILIDSETCPLSRDCIAAVLAQSYAHLDILVAGAPLPDACQAVLDGSGRDEGARSVAYLPADGASAEVGLLERAVGRVVGDLLWFVRGGVVHEVDFLVRLVSSFADNSVQLGFGRYVDGDEDALAENRFPPGMTSWNRHATSPAALWFSGNLRPVALAADQHSVLWRRRSLPGAVWRGAGDYLRLGLWHLLLHMASGGQIASVRDALARVPPARGTTTAPPYHDDFRSDVARLAAEIQTVWEVSRDALDACGRALSGARAASLGHPAESVGAAHDADRLPEIVRLKRHVLLVTHGIFAGGAENFPIQLANELVARGLIVSILIFKIDDVNPEMRATLDPGVSIYEAGWVLEYGCERFIRDIGCTLIHSHGVVGEMFFFERCDVVPAVPYVATLHGSYEASSSEDLPDGAIAMIVRRVDLFVYTADKNLKPLIRFDVRPDRLVKMANAMPIDPVPYPRTRREMGIAEDAVVFTLIARGIREKGWSTAVGAFKAVQARNPHRAMHLCLVGDGDEPERLAPLYADDPSVSFLGFQLRIHGLYRMTDVAIVPTRFAGESFPLCIIQALQVGVPVIGTDVGEIASMLRNGGATGGVVVAGSRSDEEFEARFTDAMDHLVDDERRRQLGTGAAILGASYDMAGLTEQYIAHYEAAARTFARSRQAALTECDEPDAVAGR